MSNIYYAPTKLLIDYDIHNIGNLIEEYGYKRVLVVYGKGSIKKQGLYDIVINSLKEKNLIFFEEGGVEANPKVEFVRNALAKDYDIDFILAIGGGSVIDTAKSISVSYKTNIDPWEFNAKREIPKKALPIGVILTIAAAGSEMSNSCVISNPELKMKNGFNSDLVRPKFAIMNPELTYSLPKYQMACGIVDIMMHTLERFITPYESDLADNFCIGLLKCVYKNGLIAYNDPKNYKARREIMLASSFSHNGLMELARPMCFRCHQFEHVLSAVHDEIAHGAGLAVCFPAYAKYIYKKSPIAFMRFLRLAYQVFEVEPSMDKEKDCLLGIERLVEFFRNLNMPTKMADLGIDKSELEDLSLRVSWNKTRVIEDVIPLTYKEMREIYELMF
jgi:alcohol dehydrogenase YqhD (iron-dependent ADH family)